jgi:hypothetical protein
MKEGFCLLWVLKWEKEISSFLGSYWNLRVELISTEN